MAERLGAAVGSAALSRPVPDGKGAVVGRYLFDRDFAGFRGHFPGRPVLPAVVQVMAALHVAEEAWGRGCAGTLRVDRAKFNLPIVPGDEVEVRCEMKTVSGETAFKASVSVRGKPASSFVLVLDQEEVRP
jgi:3-hydroxyacyl-[acyl-carrier-protein] dehydratase